MTGKLTRIIMAIAAAFVLVISVGVTQASAHTATDGRKHYNFSCSKAGTSDVYSGAMDIDQNVNAAGVVGFQNPAIAWSTAPANKADRWEFRMRDSADNRVSAWVLGGTIGSLNDVATYGNASRLEVLGELGNRPDIWAYMAVWDHDSGLTWCTKAVLAK